jgi:hypothetical protein
LSQRISFNAGQDKEKSCEEIKVMKLCNTCMLKHKENNWYIGSEDTVIDNVRECEAHPTMSNSRVLRTLKTIKTFSLEAAGYIHPNCKIRPMTYEGGLVHKRCLLAVLFDYEVPFVELLIEQGCLKQREGVPTLLQVTESGDCFISESLVVEMGEKNETNTETN